MKSVSPSQVHPKSIRTYRSKERSDREIRQREKRKRRRAALKRQAQAH